MRISDWSSDVCSSDLPLRAALPLRHPDLQQSGAGAANARPRSCRRLHPRTDRDIRRGGGIMTVTPDIILETREVSRHFGSGSTWLGEKRVVRAVDGISLAVRRGETLAVVGESGCGKSTLARLLVRRISPTTGQVPYQGRDIGALSEREMRGLRRDLQFVFQDPFSRSE